MSLYNKIGVFKLELYDIFELFCYQTPAKCIFYYIRYEPMYTGVSVDVCITSIRESLAYTMKISYGWGRTLTCCMTYRVFSIYSENL